MNKLAICVLFVSILSYDATFAFVFHCGSGVRSFKHHTTLSSKTDVRTVYGPCHAQLFMIRRVKNTSGSARNRARQSHGQ